MLRLLSSISWLQRKFPVTIAFMHNRIKNVVMVLRILLLLAAPILASAGVAATNSGNDWLKPAREALTVARQTLQSFDPAAGNTEALDPWDRVLGEIRLNAQKCVDARLEAIRDRRRTQAPRMMPLPGDTPAPGADRPSGWTNCEAEMAACQTLLLEARTLGDDIRSAQRERAEIPLARTRPGYLERRPGQPATGEYACLARCRPFCWIACR